MGKDDARYGQLMAAEPLGVAGHLSGVATSTREVMGTKPYHALQRRLLSSPRREAPQIDGTTGPEMLYRALAFHGAAARGCAAAEGGRLVGRPTVIASPSRSDRRLLLPFRVQSDSCRIRRCGRLLRCNR